jgi:hypothetical protein
MLTLGQASCLVLGYKPNDPEVRKKAKEHLEKSGLIAVHIRNHDPFQPLAIGINVHERDPFKFISYPDSPTIPCTDLPDNIDDHDGNDNNGNNDDSNNSDSDDNNSGNDSSNNGSDDSNSSIYKNNNSNNSNKDRSKKRKLDNTVIPFCKDRVLNLMKEIATDENPLNDNCYSKQFLTAEDQYQLMCSMFPRLKNHCSVNQLQYWIGQAKIWGKSERSRKNQRKRGRKLWVVDEQLRGKITSLNFGFPYFNNLFCSVRDGYFRLGQGILEIFTT